MPSYKNVVFESRIPTLTAQMSYQAAAVVQKTAGWIMLGAMIRSRVDTGQMRAGWNMEQISALAWRIVNNVEHTGHNEFGTRYMSAQPMLIPSVEAAAGPFAAALRTIFLAR